MSRRVSLWMLVLFVALASGCAANAKDQMEKLRVGMRPTQVQTVLGPPEDVKQVKFKGHDDYYEVWQYQMVPESPLCPSEAIPRFMTGMVTAGLSEIAWTHAKATAHWIYFLDDELVYTSPAFDCLEGEFCTVRRGRVGRQSLLRP